MFHEPNSTAGCLQQLQPAVAPCPAVPRGGLYLLHLEPRYRHAGHYLGWSTDIEARVHQHLGCGPRSSPLIRAALGAGCRVTLARVWMGEGRTRERSIKRQGGLGRVCPVCRAWGYRR